ncbi:hypothetical protein AYO47_02060 [Planctomyces sp. SCGC AG-212-M04]|nr:hypothetical protein AYO47_02060 [Planctomyces sp. SCGC AG-212-M04]
MSQEQHTGPAEKVGLPDRECTVDESGAISWSRPLALEGQRQAVAAIEAAEQDVEFLAKLIWPTRDGVARPPARTLLALEPGISEEWATSRSVFELHDCLRAIAMKKRIELSPERQWHFRDVHEKFGIPRGRWDKSKDSCGLKKPTGGGNGWTLEEVRRILQAMEMAGELKGDEVAKVRAFLELPPTPPS